MKEVLDMLEKMNVTIEYIEEHLMTIPASSWAVFEIIGPMRPLPNAMQDIWKRIYSE